MYLYMQFFTSTQAKRYAIYKYIYIHMHMKICIYICHSFLNKAEMYAMYSNMYVCVRVCVCMYVYVCIYTYIYKHMYVYICFALTISAHTHTHAYINAYIKLFRIKSTNPMSFPNVQSCVCQIVSTSIHTCTYIG